MVISCNPLRDAIVMFGITWSVMSLAQSPQLGESGRSDRVENVGPLPSIPGTQDELRPGVGETFLEPPPIPPTPEELVAEETSDNAEPMTIEAIVAIACQSNPTLTQARAQIEGELGKAIQAGLWPNPLLRYVGEQWGVGGTAGEWQGMEVQQRIVTGRKLDLSRAKFLALTRAAEWRALEQEYQVLNDVRIHFWRALGRQEIVQVQRELLKNAEDALVTSREMYNVGQATRAEVHRANAMLQRVRLDLLMAINEQRAAWWELAALAGVQMPPAPLEGALEGEVAVVDFEIALERLLSESPQILAARSKLRADEIKVRRETVEPIPDLVVSSGVGRNFEAKETTVNTAVQLEIPLYDWNQGTIRQAEADVVRQQAEVARIEFMLQRNLAQVYRQYLTALQIVRNYQEVILPESRLAYEVLLDSYKDDRAPWTTVLEAEQDYFTHRAEYISSLIAWRENETLITGYLLHGGLQPPPGPQPPGHISAVPKPR